MKNIDDFTTDKKFKKLADSLFLSLLETAIVHQKISIDDLKRKKIINLKKILLDTVNECSNTNGEVNFTIAYTDFLSKEANYLEQRRNYKLALVIYAIEIEHHLNEIIQKALLYKKFKVSEIENIMRLDIEAKRTWLFPLLDLPRLSNYCSKNIKLIADKRNEFVHYKWKGLFDSESEKLDKKYVELCNIAPRIIGVLKRYKTKNLVTASKLKKILNSKKQSNKNLKNKV